MKFLTLLLIAGLLATAVMHIKAQDTDTETSEAETAEATTTVAPTTAVPTTKDGTATVTPTTAVPTTVEELRCSTGINSLISACPGFSTMFRSSSISSTDLGSFCPCATDAFLESHKLDLYKVYYYCNTSTLQTVQLLNNVMCRTNTANSYCGKEYSNFNTAMNEIKGYVIDGNAVPSSLLDQTETTNTCTECFDNMVAGYYAMYGALVGASAAEHCGTDCKSSIASIINDMSGAFISSAVCLTNTNTTQAVTSPRCFPYVYSYLNNMADHCTSLTTQGTCQRVSECVWHDSKCQRVVSVSPLSHGKIILPPYNLVDTFGKNSCFERIQSAYIDAATMLTEMYALLTMSKPTIASFAETSTSLAYISDYMYIGNKNGTCIEQLDKMRTVTGCTDAEITSFWTSSVSCSSACATAMAEVFTDLDCCTGILNTLQTSADTDLQIVPNFAGIASKCSLSLKDECSVFQGEPQSVTVTLSGTCTWLAANTQNLEVLKNATAKAIGISPRAISNFGATSLTGAACSSTSARRGKALASDDGLKGSFSVAARSTAVATQLATAVNSMAAISIPVVEKDVAQVAQVSTNTAVASQITDPPTTVIYVLNSSATTTIALAVMFAALFLGIIA